MILAFHSIFSFHGFWLPNDARGSGSNYVANWDLFRGYGPATQVSTRHSVARKPHDHARRMAAKETLKSPAVQITGQQALTISIGFAAAIKEAGYRIHACAILPDHVHLVIGWHPRDVEIIVKHLKSNGTRQLRKNGEWDERKLWGEHGWNVYLNEVADVERAIAYVEANPLKEGKRRQRWSFVTPFDLQLALADRSALQATQRVPGLNRNTRKIGGAALNSHERKLRRNV